MMINVFRILAVLSLTILVGCATKYELQKFSVKFLRDVDIASAITKSQIILFESNLDLSIVVYDPINRLVLDVFVGSSKYGILRESERLNKLAVEDAVCGLFYRADIPVSSSFAPCKEIHEEAVRLMDIERQISALKAAVDGNTRSIILLRRNVDANAHRISKLEPLVKANAESAIGALRVASVNSVVNDTNHAFFKRVEATVQILQTDLRSIAARDARFEARVNSDLRQMDVNVQRIIRSLESIR